MSGIILLFSSYQIELVLTLDLLFGRSGLSFKNKPGEHLEETDAASEQKSLTDCLFTALTSVVTPVFICRNSAEFLIQKIPDAHLLLNSRVDQRQVIAFKVHGFDWSMMINSLIEKAFPVAPNIIHIIEFCKQCPIGSHLRTKE